MVDKLTVDVFGLTQDIAKSVTAIRFVQALICMYFAMNTVHVIISGLWCFPAFIRSVSYCSDWVFPIT